MRSTAALLPIALSLGLACCAHADAAPRPVADSVALDPEVALQGVVCELPDDTADPAAARGEVVREAEHALDVTARAHQHIERLRARALSTCGNDRANTVVRCLGDKLVEARATLCFMRTHHALLQHAVVAADPERTRYEQRLMTIGRSRCEALLTTVEACEVPAAE